jgi:hypothetical protein
LAHHWGEGVSHGAEHQYAGQELPVYLPGASLMFRSDDFLISTMPKIKKIVER